MYAVVTKGKDGRVVAKDITEDVDKMKTRISSLENKVQTTQLLLDAGEIINGKRGALMLALQKHLENLAEERVGDLDEEEREGLLAAKAYAATLCDRMKKSNAGSLYIMYVKPIVLPGLSEDEGLPTLGNEPLTELAENYIYDAAIQIGMKLFGSLEDWRNLDGVKQTRNDISHRLGIPASAICKAIFSQTQSAEIALGIPEGQVKALHNCVQVDEQLKISQDPLWQSLTESYELQDHAETERAIVKKVATLVGVRPSDAVFVDAGWKEGDETTQLSVRQVKNMRRRQQLAHNKVSVYQERLRAFSEEVAITRGEVASLCHQVHKEVKLGKVVNIEFWNRMVSDAINASVADFEESAFFVVL